MSEIVKRAEEWLEFNVAADRVRCLMGGRPSPTIDLVHDLLSALAECQREREEARAAALEEAAGKWQSLPDDIGYWWWWNGDPDEEPFPVNIGVGLTGELRYFAEQGQHGWNRAQWVEDMGGEWMKLEAPTAIRALIPERGRKG